MSWVLAGRPDRLRHRSRSARPPTRDLRSRRSAYRHAVPSHGPVRYHGRATAPRECRVPWRCSAEYPPWSRRRFRRSFLPPGRSRISGRGVTSPPWPTNRNRPVLRLDRRRRIGRHPARRSCPPSARPGPACRLRHCGSCRTGKPFHPIRCEGRIARSKNRPCPDRPGADRRFRRSRPGCPSFPAKRRNPPIRFDRRAGRGWRYPRAIRRRGPDRGRASRNRLRHPICRARAGNRCAGYRPDLKTGRKGNSRFPATRPGFRLGDRSRCLSPGHR